MQGQNKWLRALPIRIAMQDRRRTADLLRKLQNLYQISDKAALDNTRLWLQELQKENFDQWQALMLSLAPYPDQ